MTKFTARDIFRELLYFGNHSFGTLQPADNLLVTSPDLLKGVARICLGGGC